MTLDQARAEIRRGAGVQFDPVLARLFLDGCRTSGAAGVAPAETESTDHVDDELPAPKRTADD